MVNSRKDWSSTRRKDGKLLTPTLNFFEEKNGYSFYSMRAFEATAGYNSELCGILLRSAILGKCSKDNLLKMETISNSTSQKTCFIKHIDQLKNWKPNHIFTYMKAAALRDLYAFNTYKVTTVDTRIWKPFIDMDKVTACPYLKIVNGQLYFALEHPHVFL